MTWTWYNEPPAWNVAPDTIRMTAGAKSDFWRRTHSGIVQDNGHFFYVEQPGDFSAEVKIVGAYRDLYDQAGLMVRIDESNWLKCGVEYVHDIQQASVVVTRDYSDWSVVPLAHNPSTVWTRAIRRGTSIELAYSLDGSNFVMVRMAHLPMPDSVHVGLMCAAPAGGGFPVTFEGFSLRSA